MLQHFLSDEFVEFSAKINDIHVKKKALKEEYERFRETFNENVKSLNETANSLIKEFDAWKEEFEKNSKSPVAEPKKS
jgi:cell fate (sporulation/competence/biofilm development) regulator YlbF (YheA/YmcA/DUF963 family)